MSSHSLPERPNLAHLKNQAKDLLKSHRDADPEGREIEWCPNRGIDIRACSTTLKVEVGYSAFVRLAGQRVVLANLDGKTDGTPPGVVHYQVRDPGQRFVVVSG